MSVGRHACRIAVVKAIFAEDFREQEEERLVDMILERLKLAEKDRSYVEETLKGVFSHMKELKEIVAKYALERPLEEINPVNRAILYLGAYEILFGDRDKVPLAVAINEAIEVARELSDESGIAFVNGVLSKISEEVQKQDVES